MIPESGVERFGGLSDEHGERVSRGRDRLLVGRQLRLQARKLRTRGVHVGLAGETVLVPSLREIGDLALRRDFIQRDLPQGLARPQLEISLRHLGLE